MFPRNVRGLLHPVHPMQIINGVSCQDQSQPYTQPFQLLQLYFRLEQIDPYALLSI